MERAKNRPFHCNICGKGFATESSLRTHTSKVSHVCTKSDVQIRKNSLKKNSRGAGILTEGVETKWKEEEIDIDVDLFRQSRVNTFANRSSNDDNLALTLSRATRSVTRTHAYGGGGFTLASIFSVDGFPFKRSLCIRRFLCSVSRAPYIIDVSQAS